MFIANVFGKEEVNKLAANIGCKAGETLKGNGSGKPGLIGKTFDFKEELKAAGARWDGDEKAWTFDSWDALEAALRSIAA